MVELLSIKDISERLGIPQSTLRYYRDIFNEYLPSCGEGKKKRFFKEAIDVFAAIAKGMQQNKPADEISADLNLKFARFIEVKETTETKPNQASGISKMKEKILYGQQENFKDKEAVSEVVEQNKYDKDDFGGDNQSQYHNATKSPEDKIGQLQVLNNSVVNPEVRAIMTIIENQNQTMKEIASTLTIVTEHQEEITSLKKEVAKLEEQVEEQLLKHFQIIDSKLEQIAEKRGQSASGEKNKPKSFWQRMFG